jgi:hypothetical protein
MSCGKGSASERGIVRLEVEDLDEFLKLAWSFLLRVSAS